MSNISLSTKAIFKPLINLLAFVGFSFLLSGCSIFSQDAEDSRVPVELKEFTPQLKVQSLWSSKIGDAAEGLGFGLSPSVKSGVVYIASYDGVVRALNAKTGALIWKNATGVSVTAGPSIGAGQVVVGSNNGDIISIDANTGKVQWRSVVGGEVITPPTVGLEQIAVRSANGSLNVLSTTSGELIWQDEQEVPRLSLRGSSMPLVTKGVVIAGNDSGKISSYNALDGGVVWERLLGLPRGTTELERLVDIDGKIGINDDNIYVVGFNSRLAKIDARTGNILWSKEYSSNNGVDLGWKDIYLSNTDGHVVAVDQETGSLTWKSEEYQYRQLTAPLATTGAIVVGDLEGYIHFLSSTDGTTIARQKISKAPIRVTPVAEGNLIYVQSDDGKIVAFKILDQ